MQHPEVATRSCESCKTWQYDKNGEIAKRGGRQLKRIGNPPCHLCPKESPEKAHEHELSQKNQRTLDLYYRTRAMSGANLTDAERQDEIVQRNLAIIDRIMRSYESERALMVSLAATTPPAPVNPTRSRR